MFKMRRVKFTFVLCAVILIAATALTGLAKAAEIKFPKRNIVYSLPTRPGGGTDSYARFLSPLWCKHLGPKAKMILKNLPGAEHAIGVNYCLRSRPADGHTVVAMLIPGYNLNGILGMGQFDLNEAVWIGSVTRVPNIFFISSKRKERTLKEVQEASKREPLKCATAGLGSPAGAGSAVAAELLGIRTKFIPHQSQAPAALSVLRGDADYNVTGYTAVKSLHEDGHFIPLWTYGTERYPTVPDVPTIVELGHPELVAPFQMHYCTATRKGVPDKILAILRSAFKKAVEEPAFAKAMEKAGSKAIYTSGEGMAKALVAADAIYIKYKHILEKYR